MDAENKKHKPRPIWVVAANIKHEYSYKVGGRSYPCDGMFDKNKLPPLYYKKEPD